MRARIDPVRGIGRALVHVHKPGRKRKGAIRMTRRHIAWLIGIIVIGLVLATRNAPLRHAAPPGFTLLPSTLPGQPSRIAGPGGEK